MSDKKDDLSETLKKLQNTNTDPLIDLITQGVKSEEAACEKWLKVLQHYSGM